MKAVLFCVQTHLPGYVKEFDRLKEKGMDVLACVSVNDAYVMAAWGEIQQVAGKIRMLADTTGAFTKVGQYWGRDLVEVIVRYVSCAGCGSGARRDKSARQHPV